MPLLQKLTTNLFSRENTCSKMYQSYMERCWKEYKHQWWNLVLREHMPKEETSRQQVTNSHSRANRLHPLPTQSTRKGTTLARHIHEAMSDSRLQCTKPTDFTLFMGLTASNWVKNDSGFFSIFSVSTFTSTMGLRFWARSKEASALLRPTDPVRIKNWAPGSSGDT